MNTQIKTPSSFCVCVELNGYNLLVPFKEIAAFLIPSLLWGRERSNDSLKINGELRNTDIQMLNELARTKAIQV